MKLSRKTAFLCALLLAVTAGAAGQTGHHGHWVPKIPTPFKPVVGKGAEYHFTGHGENANIAFAVVGKEQVGGKKGYWFEIRVKSRKSNGELVIKELMAMNGNPPEVKRLIIQSPGRPAMELPSGMLGMMKQNGNSSEDGIGKKIGTASITVPAGTFNCSHYRTEQVGSPVDLWVSDKVPPYGLVKMVGKNTSMVLQKVLTHETSHIKGTPLKIQMPHY